MLPQLRATDNPEVILESSFHHTLINIFRVLGIYLLKKMCHIYEQVHDILHIVEVEVRYVESVPCYSCTEMVF